MNHNLPSPLLCRASSTLRLLVTLFLGASHLSTPHLAAADSDSPHTLTFHTRHREPLTSNTNAWRVVEQISSAKANRTAIIVCDMWDQHWCAGATARVTELAPRMNQVLQTARQHGVLIIHAPSDTMKSYADFPQRLRAQQTPKADAPADTRQWKSLNLAKEPPLPIDDSDGGCDDDPQCAQRTAWRQQIAALEILPEDVISDSGEEIYNVLAARDVDTVIILGVHTNMCVLGRPFSIRSLVGLGKRVFLMRDMTDTMYNSRRRPYVSHFAGTDLVVEHIEKYWCPSITSADFLGGEPFRFSADHRRTVVFIVGENEYRTWETLPEFGRTELNRRGILTELTSASTATDDFRFTNQTAVARADLLVISTRRRAMSREMMQTIRAHLAAGKPLIGIRTASHAFAVRGEAQKRVNADETLADWPGFDPEVLGGNYRGHHGAGPLTTVRLPEGVATHPILTGVDTGALASKSSLYQCGPLQPATHTLLLGTIPGRPEEPLAWTHSFGPGQTRVFYTSLGGPDDFQNPAFRRLLLNAMLWAMKERIPPATD
jgi:nicotinamidase-related amidase/type 1 glutamine amidotransferase